MAGSWGRPIEVPGLRALAKARDTSVNSVSCASTGNCAAGGDYRDGNGHLQGFVVSEKNGVWGQAIEVPGLGALNTGGDAQVLSVSCGSAGNCAAGGYYGPAGNGQGFVVSEKNGVWGQAIEVPGLGALNTARIATVVSVSCASAGNCAAGGDYKDGNSHLQGFVVSEKNGVWGQAIEVPGLGALNAGGKASVNSVSCGSAGNCAAGGYYGPAGNGQGFVVSEKNGVWGQAIEVPGLGALNTARIATVVSVSCASAGNCAAGGSYTNGPYGDSGQSFVVSEKNGVWGQAIEVAAALNAGAEQPGGGVASVSCTSAGNCAAGGSYGYPYGSAFVINEKNGVWGQAIDTGPPAQISDVGSVSCASPGNCVAAGRYFDGNGTRGFVVSEKNGVWGKAITVAGAASVSCAPAGSCAAVGGYKVQGS